jgi:putative protease
MKKQPGKTENKRMLNSTEGRLYMNDHKLELLAPAGSFESLKAAVSGGADAVYLGGGKYNARINAGNFSEKDLVEALDYAHERGVRVYITINTLLKNHELYEALKLAEFVHKEGADAIIVQDTGFAKLLRENFPETDIHASTQMTTTDSNTVKFLEESGFKRVVLSRELTFDDIKLIRESCKADLEVFVHGALCVCYSGQCLMSSFIGARSGNRGLCAQPCRLPWSLSRDCAAFGKSSYLLSPRDLMALELLPELKKVGVKALKLEGRMKSPEYVAIVTSVYRKYLNMLESNGESGYQVEEIDREKLMQAFNRGGFTRGYLEGSRNFRKLVYPEHPKNQGIPLGKVLDTKPLYIKVLIEKPVSMGDGIEIMDPDKGVQSFTVTSIILNNKQVRSAETGAEVWIGDVKTSVKKGSRVFRTLSRSLFDEARKIFEGKEQQLVPIDMEFSMKAGERAVLKVKDIDGNIACAESAETAEKAIKAPLSEERIRQQLVKTGDTPYWVKNLYIETDNDSTMPVSALNALRREALEKIKEIRISKRKKEISKSVYYNVKATNDLIGMKPELSAYFFEAPDSIDALSGLIKRVYIPVIMRQSLEEIRKGFDGEVYLWLPSVLKDGELAEIIEQIKEVRDLATGLTYGSFGTYRALREAFPDISLCAGPSMNVFNNEAIQAHEELGAESIVVSPELNLKEVKDMASSKARLESVVYGRITLMTMEHCPSALEIGCSGRCDKCKGSRGYLKDRRGEVFPFIRDPILKRTQIFNTFPLFMDDMEALKGTPLSIYRLIFTTEDKNTRNALVRYFYEKLNGLSPAHDVISTIETLKSSGYTRGHWYRGVE